MQQFLGDVAEDREYYVRKERRRERRLQEKRRRETKIRIIKTAVFGIIITGILALCIYAVIGSNTKIDKNRDNIQAKVPYEENQKKELENEEAEIGVQKTESVVSVQPIEFQETEDTKSIISETIISKYAILVDADTDTIIGKRNAYDKMVPASMTKVLTALVAAEAIDQEDLEDTFTMTLEITDYAYVNDCKDKSVNVILK